MFTGSCRFLSCRRHVTAVEMHFAYLHSHEYILRVFYDLLKGMFATGPDGCWACRIGLPGKPVQVPVFVSNNNQVYFSCAPSTSAGPVLPRSGWDWSAETLSAIFWDGLGTYSRTLRILWSKVRGLSPCRLGPYREHRTVVRAAFDFVAFCTAFNTAVGSIYLWGSVVLVWQYCQHLKHLVIFITSRI